MATTRTATLSGITTRTATLLWSKRPHCFGQNGHIGWVATKTATLFFVKTATLFWAKRPQGGLYLNEQKWLPKWLHCIWSKRPQIVCDINFVKTEYLNAFAWHPKTSIIQLWISKIYLWISIIILWISIIILWISIILADWWISIIDTHNSIMDIHNSSIYGYP